VIAETVIEEAGRRIAKAAPQARVILFGSYARGEAGPDSDLDLLVVEPQVPDRHREMVRLERELRSLSVPVDVIVVSRSYLDDWAGVDGTIVYAALSEGRVLDGAA